MYKLAKLSTLNYCLYICDDTSIREREKGNKRQRETNRRDSERAKENEQRRGKKNKKPNDKSNRKKNIFLFTTFLKYLSKVSTML